MKNGAKCILLLVALLIAAPIGLLGQSKGKAVKKPSAPTSKPTSKPRPEDTTPVPAGPKKNERPTGVALTSTIPSGSVYQPVYFYEFSRPGFVYSKIAIEHDEAGTGRITFQRDGATESITDPVQLSEATLTKLKAALTSLNFLDSTEVYQTVRDYSHMGQTTLRVKRDGRERTVAYNWTDNKDAKFLMDEYRRISNEYTWRFEMISARENQPLLTPGLVDTLDSYLRRGEISDPPSLRTFMTKFSGDERLPLIARNHLVRLIAQIEKAAKK